MGISVFHCDTCEKAYTAKETEKFEVKHDKVKDEDYKLCPDDRTALKEIEPEPMYKFSYEEWQAGVEKFYFWLLDKLRDEKGYDVEKLVDTYTASEASEFFGLIEQRKGQASDKAMQYLATIGSLLKQLFQIVRELMNMDERLEYYKSYHNKDDKDFDAKDITLKAIWVDRVEGGAQKPTSIYGMALQLGFTTLPDLFFATKVREGETVSEVVKRQEETGFNRKVLEVLQRKLEEYDTWRVRTEREMLVGREFRLQYLRQHFHIIRMYLNWVKPYLRHVGRLNMYSPEETKNKKAWAEIIGASQSAVIDLELFGLKKIKKWKPEKSYYSTNTKGVKFSGLFHQCLRIVFHYRTRPQLVYTREYQKGPIQVGISEISFEAYVLNDEDIKKYKEQKLNEDLKDLQYVYGSIEALNEPLKKYLDEAKDPFFTDKDKKKEEDKKGAKKSVSLRVKEIIDSWKKGLGVTSKAKKTPPLPPAYNRKKEKRALRAAAQDDLYWLFENLRKKYELVTK